MFIKRGDGKITEIIDLDNLSEEQKKAAKEKLDKESKIESKDGDKNVS